MEPQLTLLSVVVFFLVYFIGAIGEEIGWSGYISDPLQNPYGALKASLILGTIWAVWHTHTLEPGSPNYHMDSLAIYWHRFFTGCYGLDI